MWEGGVRLASVILQIIEDAQPPCSPERSPGHGSKALTAGTTMTTRTTRTTVTFRRPFSLKGATGMLPAGDYRVFADGGAHRWIVVSGLPPGCDPDLPLAVRSDSSGMFTIDPQDLAAAQEQDRATAER
jgi:hypothetical protein